MFHHISVAVHRPLQVGTVLAEIFQGRCFPFPPHPGSYMTILEDGFGTGIELYPIDTQLIPARNEVGFSSNNVTSTFTSVHAAISVSTTQAQIEEIAHREGWLVRLCDRGPFKVLELWVENTFMLELLTPEMAKEYLEFAKLGNLEAFFNSHALVEV